MMKKQLFSHIREDTCIYCHRDRAIELYDRNNNGIKFSFILDTNKVILLDRREVRYGKCRFCHREFLLDWTSDTRIPRPLLSSNYQNYLQQYNKSKIT